MSSLYLIMWGDDGIASLGTASERQDRQADSVVQVHTSHEPVQSSVQTSKHE